MQLNINAEFQDLIPPLSPEELSGLEQSLLTEGCRDPLVVWNNTIIDGHHRYTICQKHNISFETAEAQGLETELDVKIWMINNQFSRRNLPSIVRMDLVLQRKSLEEEKALQRKQQTQFHNNDTDRSPVTYPLDEKGKTLEILAKQADVSYGQLFQYNKILEKGSEEEKLAVRNNEISIKGAFQKIQKAERLANNIIAEWPKDKYRVIYADPPWQYGDERSGMGGAVDHYSTMSLENIKALSVKELTEDNAVLFMWATAPLLKEAIEVVEAWGFAYKTHVIWNKVKPNIGNYVSPRHELLFIATKGSCTPDVNERPNSVQTIERAGRHSEKPEEFRNIIETLYTYGNKIELFARKSVEGWEVFGNECNGYTDLKVAI